MRCLLVALGLLLAVSGVCAQNVPAGADSASTQDIERLMAAMHVHDRVQLIMENSRKQSKTMFEEILRKELPDATKDELVQMQGMIDDMIDYIHKDYPIDAVMHDMVPVYQRHLTKSDAEGLIAFYSSSLGQKLLHELPAITTEAMEVSNAHLEPRMEAAITQLKEKAMKMVEEDRKNKRR